MVAPSEADGMASKGRMYGALGADAVDETVPLTPELPAARDGSADACFAERVQTQGKRYRLMQMAVVGAGTLAVAGTVAYSGGIAAQKSSAAALEESAAVAPMPASVAMTNGFDDTSGEVAMDNGMYAEELVASYSKDEGGLYIPSTDPNATRATRALLTALVDVSNTDSIMFGHENTNIEGQWFWDE